jgi:hypothetical protein
MIAAPAIVTMVLVALWHGATFPFLFFGLLHAAFLVVNHGWRLARAIWATPDAGGGRGHAAAAALPRIVSIALTYLCVLTGVRVVPRRNSRGRLERAQRYARCAWRWRPAVGRPSGHRSDLAAVTICHRLVRALHSAVDASRTGVSFKLEAIAAMGGGHGVRCHFGASRGWWQRRIPLFQVLERDPSRSSHRNGESRDQTES